MAIRDLDLAMWLSQVLYVTLDGQFSRCSDGILGRVALLSDAIRVGLRVTKSTGLKTSLSLLNPA